VPTGHFGRENDPETSIIARTIGFARIDSSSTQALNYGDTSALPHGAQAFRVHNSGCMPAAADDPGCSVPYPTSAKNWANVISLCTNLYRVTLCRTISFVI